MLAEVMAFFNSCLQVFPVAVCKGSWSVYFEVVQRECDTYCRLRSSPTETWKMLLLEMKIKKLFLIGTYCWYRLQTTVIRQRKI